MTNFVMLNREEHHNIHIDTSRSEAMGDAVQQVMTFPFEFRNVQAHYPIFFQKNADSGRFYPVALFGFEENENLFLTPEGWSSSYIPSMIRRQPFLIGFQQEGGDSGAKKAVVTIDMDSPRVNTEHGEALFMEHGGTSQYLQDMTQNLELIHQANTHCEAFADALVEHDLLEQFALNVESSDGTVQQMLGYYTINEEKLQSMGSDALGKFSDQGFLMPAFMVIASHSCLRNLIEMKNGLG